MSSALETTPDEAVPDGDDTVERHLTVAPEPADTDTADTATATAEVETGVGEQAEPKRSLTVRFDRAVDRALGKLEWVTPPDIVRQDRPSLGKMWRHARHGSYAAGNHITRVLGVTYALFALVYTAWQYLKAWVAERPTRAAIAAVVLTVAAATPLGRDVLTVALWLPAQLIHLLTNF